MPVVDHDPRAQLSMRFMFYTPIDFLRLAYRPRTVGTFRLSEAVLEGLCRETSIPGLGGEGQSVIEVVS